MPDVLDVFRVLPRGPTWPGGLPNGPKGPPPVFDRSNPYAISHDQTIVSKALEPGRDLRAQIEAMRLVGEEHIDRATAKLLQAHFEGSSNGGGGEVVSRALP